MATLKVVFKAIDEISSKFNEMTQSGERALEAFENTGTAADGALSKVSRTAAQTAKSTDAAADSVDDLSSAIGDYEKATGQAANSTGILSEKTTETEKNLDEAAEAARKASEEVEKFCDKSEETGKQSEESTKKGRDGIKELQGVLASAGIAATLNEIKNGFFDCSEAAAQFETSTAMVATIADTSQKSLSSISKEVRSYSNETGEAASDMAEATYQAISASINTADAAAFAGTATKLAVGGFTSATTAVDVLTTAINAYGLAASDATQLSDYLITTQNLGKTSVDQLAQSVGKVIPLASAYNVQMDNLSSAYAVLTANGIATAESGTYLKSMLNELGDTGSGVSEVLLNSTGKTFAQLMEQGYSLGDVMAMLGNARPRRPQRVPTLLLIPSMTCPRPSGTTKKPPDRQQILPASCQRKRPRPRRTSTRQRRQPVKPRMRSRSSAISPRKLESRARNRAKRAATASRSCRASLRRPE